MNSDSKFDLDRYERILDLAEQSPLLKGFIVIHNTSRGLALGGTRVINYETIEEAKNDALNLAKAMTYKCAISNLPFGGGKGVLIADNKALNFEKILQEYAEVIKSLNGQFYTGVDVGLTPQNVEYMLKFAPYFIGKPNQADDPSHFAALTCFNSIITVLKFLNSDEKKFSLAIKGAGKTGYALIKMCLPYSKEIYVTDINKDVLRNIEKQSPTVKVVAPTEIHKMAVDVFAPCALGSEINPNSINEIKAKVICGTANNQLSNKLLADKLQEKGIIYVPDFVANSGGLIDVADELLPGGYSATRVHEHINQMNQTLSQLLADSVATNKNLNTLAVELAESRF